MLRTIYNSLFTKTNYSAEIEALKSQVRHTVIILLSTFIVMVFSTLAWFANNNKVKNQGMEIQTQISPSLVIVDELSKIPNAKATDTVIIYSEPVMELAPAHHGVINLETNETLLYYNTNPQDVSYSSGYEVATAQLYFNDVPIYQEEDLHRYYRDYVAYITSVNDSMILDSLNVTMNYGDTIPEEGLKNNYFNAASVDFYMAYGEAELAYKGTLNLAGKDYKTNTSLDPNMLDLTIKNADEQMDIPYHLSASNNYIKVLMRFYFDGALEETTNVAYVHSDDLILKDFTMNISFIAN